MQCNKHTVTLQPNPSHATSANHVSTIKVQSSGSNNLRGLLRSLDSSRSAVRIEVDKSKHKLMALLSSDSSESKYPLSNIFQSKINGLHSFKNSEVIIRTYSWTTSSTKVASNDYHEVNMKKLMTILLQNRMPWFIQDRIQFKGIWSHFSVEIIWPTIDSPIKCLRKI
jgi:hypothetical protein